MSWPSQLSLLAFTALLLSHFQAIAMPWTTTTHMAYAVNRQSSTGFEKIGGSMTYIDVSHDISSEFDLGLRTLAQGGKAKNLEFYRLGSGPVVGWLPNRSWRFEFGMATFRESGLAPDGNKIYRSQGKSWSLGWERRRQLYPKVNMSYGGLLMAHRGELVGLAAQSNKFPPPAGLRNDGLAQVLQVGLHIQLD